MPYLHRYEAKKIQSWILSSDRLKEVKGTKGRLNFLEQQAEVRYRYSYDGRDPYAEPARVYKRGQMMLFTILLDNSPTAQRTESPSWQVGAACRGLPT